LRTCACLLKLLLLLQPSRLSPRVAATALSSRYHRVGEVGVRDAEGGAREERAAASTTAAAAAAAIAYDTCNIRHDHVSGV